MLDTAKEAWFQPASDQSLIVYLGTEISLETHQHVIKLLRLLEREPIAGVCDVHPAYCSLLINFDLLTLRHDELEAVLRSYLDRLDEESVPEPRYVEIPVCYEGDFGPDLGDVCATLRITPAQAIELHGSVAYVVYFLGICSRFCISGRIAEIADDAAPPIATAHCATWQRRNRRKPDRRLSLCYPRRMETDRTHATTNVPQRTECRKCVVHWGSGAIRVHLSQTFRRVGEHMSSIQIQSPGLFTTVQDLGRPGFGPMGLSPSGAADPLSLRLGIVWWAIQTAPPL